MRLTLLPIIALIASAGCRPAVDRSYAQTAQYRYERGMEALESGDYLEAVKDFNQVKNKFSYSKFAALAELRVADAYFEQDKQVLAIDAYEAFVQRRPNHAQVPYAMWRIGEAYFKQLPSDFFLLPPPHEKDQGSTRDAIRAIQRFVDRFPDDEHVSQAKARILRCRQSLADHELYVAGFYLKQDRPQSAVGRLETVQRDFADVPDRWRQGCLLLTEAYARLDRPEDAKSAAAALAQKYPESDEAARARQLPGVP